MEIAMLMIGLLLGGCVSFCILGCIQIPRRSFAQKHSTAFYLKRRLI